MTAMREVVSQGAEASRSLSTSASGPISLANLKSNGDLNQRLHKAVQAGSDAALVQVLAAEVYQQYEMTRIAATAENKRILAERVVEFEVSRFLWTYMRAYFRSGRIFQTQLKTQQFEDALVGFLKSKLSEPLPSKDEEKIRKELAGKLDVVCKENGDAGCLLTSHGKDKLVTRSGETLQFTGVTLAIGYDKKVQATLDYPKSSEFAPQLVRVAAEAAFDALYPRVPAVASATACTPLGSEKVQLYADHECLTEKTLANDKTVEKRVADVDEKAARADSLAGALAGQLIRGFNIVALNNEAAAKTVENLAAVTARKVTERVAWRQTSCSSTVPAFYLNVTK